MITLPPQLIKKAVVGKSTIRYGDIPPTKTSDENTAILFIAGQKSPLERFFALSEYFSQYYRTYNYEIPGFGVAKRNPASPATIQTLSDEIGEFIEKVITEPKVIIVAGSVAFWFATQALLDNKNIQQRVVKLISLFGMLGKDTFTISPIKKSIVLATCNLAKTRIMTNLVESLLRNDRIVRWYSKHLIRKRHLSHLPIETQREFEEFEIFLIKTGDWGIHFSTLSQYLTKNIERTKHISTPLLALYTQNDEYFPLENQKRMFAQVYTDITWVKMESKRHAPLIVKDYKEYRDIVPETTITEFLTRSGTV